MRNLAIALVSCSVSLPVHADPTQGAKPSAEPLSRPIQRSASASTTSEVARCEPNAARRALAIAASVAPGVLAHGAGHWVLCEDATALRLVSIESIAAAGTVVSLAGLAVTGASRYVVAPLALGALGGVGLFTTSWLADIYGVAAPEGGTGQPSAVKPRFTAQGGVRGVYDPLFRTRWLLSQAFRVDSGLVSISPRMDASPDGRHRRYALTFDRRLFGAHRDLTRHSPWELGARLALRDFAETHERFGITSLELALTGRADLELFGATLRGAFAEAEAGYSREWHRFQGGVPGYTWDALLGRFAFGMYLGHGAVRGETWVAYDHRRDTVAGGLHLPSIPAGYAGYLEHRTELYFGRSFGAAIELAYGSAFVASGYLLFQLPRGGS